MLCRNEPDLSHIRRCMFCNCNLRSGNHEGVCGCLTCQRIKVALNVNGVTFIETQYVREIRTHTGRLFKIIGLARGRTKAIKKNVLLDLAAFAVFKGEPYDFDQGVKLAT